MEEDEVSWERVVYEARKKPDDPIAKVFLETDEELAALREALLELATNPCLASQQAALELLNKEGE